MEHKLCKCHRNYKYLSYNKTCVSDCNPRLLGNEFVRYPDAHLAGGAGITRIIENSVTSWLDCIPGCSGLFELMSDGFQLEQTRSVNYKKSDPQSCGCSYLSVTTTECEFRIGGSTHRYDHLVRQCNNEHPRDISGELINDYIYSHITN